MLTERQFSDGGAFVWPPSDRRFARQDWEVQRRLWFWLRRFAVCVSMLALLRGGMNGWLGPLFLIPTASRVAQWEVTRLGPLLAENVIKVRSDRPTLKLPGDRRYFIPHQLRMPDAESRRTNNDLLNSRRSITHHCAENRAWSL